MTTNKLQWKRIAKGDKLPCDSLLMKKDGTIPSVVSGAGVKVGQDAYYLPVEEIRALPKEKSEDERMIDELIAMAKCYTFEGEEERQRVIAWLEKQYYNEESEKEKRVFVGDGFILCCANFQDFKEGHTYWLEYIGNDNYNVRSDNLLGKTYHITPCQLYTIFKKQTWLEKQGEPTDIPDDAVLDSNKDGLIADTILSKKIKE